MPELSHIGLVIPCLDAADYLEALLASLTRHWDPRIQAIAVIEDDGGSDGGATKAVLERFHFPGEETRDTWDWKTPRRALLHAQVEGHRGFAACVNTGIRWFQSVWLRPDEEPARRMDGIVVFNADQEVSPRWLEWLLRAVATHPKLGMVSSELVEGDENDLLRFQKQHFFEAHADHLLLKHRGNRRLSQCKGSPWLFPRHVLEQIAIPGTPAQFFDERFQYGTFEDSDLMVRIWQAGWECAKVMNSVAFHHVGSRGQQAAARRCGYNYAFGNRDAFLAKWGAMEMERLLPPFEGID